MKTSFLATLRGSIWVIAALALSFNVKGQVTFSDLGPGVAPTPGAYDIFQLSTNGEALQPDGLTYTTDNGPLNDLWAGQTFTTGSNCGGYTLNAIAIYTAGLNNGGGYSTSQAHDLYLFAYSGFIYNPVAYFQAVGSFTDGDWVRWDGLAASAPILSPNTQYAFAFGRDAASQGFATLGNAGGNLYSGGELALIPAEGGAPVVGSSHSYDATFDIGLTPVVQAPSFTNDLSSESLQVYPGRQVVFSAGVCPSAVPLSYQWMWNGTTALVDGAKVLGSQTATLSITGVAATNAGSYSVIVSNASGSVTSGSATLTVLSLPAANTYAAAVLSNSPIAYYRLNETVGPTAHEFINGANGTYQGAALVGQTGVPNPPYLGFETANLAVGCDNTQVGSWTLAPFGSLGVSNVTLTCWVKPIGTQNGRTGLIFQRSSAYTGGGGGLATRYDPPILSYTWNNNNANTFYWDALNLTIPTNMWSLCGMAISPTQAVLYVLNLNGFNAATNAIPHTPDTFPNTWEIGNDALQADSSRTFNGGIDEVAIFTNALSYQQMVTLFQAGYAASMAPPTISVQPVPELLLPGRTAHFSVTAASLGTQTYRWLFNGTPLSDGNGISGSTTTTLVIQNVQSANVGSYSVIVANQGGSTTSSTATLGLASISTAYEAAMTNLNPVGYWRFNEASAAPYAFDYWGGFTGAYGSAAVNAQAGPQAPTFPGFEAANYSVQTAAAANSWVAVPPLQLNTNRMTITAWVYPTASQQGSAAIVYCRSPNSSEAAGLTCNGGGGTHIGYAWHNDVNTYHWVPSLTTPLNMWSFCALVIEPDRATIYVYNANTTAPGATSSQVYYYPHIVQTFNYTTYIGTDIYSTTGARTYKGDIDEVGIFNRALTSSEIAQLYTAAAGTPLAPSIALQPQTTGVYSGGTAHLTVLAGGSGPVYQWQLNGVNLANGNGISGADTATLTITNATAGSVGNYSVIVTNASGSVTSAPAVLTVGTVTSAYERSVLALSPLAYYRLNETNGSSIASDYAGGFDGTYGVAAVAGVAGLPNPPFEGLEMTNLAVQLQQQPAYVTNSFVTAPFGPLGIPNVTIMCWCYPMGAQVARSTLVFSRSVPPGAGGLQYLNTTTLGYTWNQNNTSTYSYNSGLAVPPYTWSMCAMTISPTNCVLYLFNATNGLHSATNAIAHSADGFGYPGLWRIGDDSSIANGGHGFKGMISQVAVFPSQLTRSQLLSLCDVAISPTVTIQRSGTNVTLTWPVGTLQSAPAMTGPWTSVTTSSPYIVTPTSASQQFFRVNIP